MGKIVNTLTRRLMSVVEFFWATGEPRIFRFYRILALLTVSTTLWLGFTLSALAPSNGRGALVIVITLMLAGIEAFALVLAEIRYEDTHGLYALRISDDEELD